MNVMIKIAVGSISSNLNKADELAAILEGIAAKVKKGEVLENDLLCDCEAQLVGSIRITKRTKKEQAEMKAYDEQERRLGHR